MMRPIGGFLPLRFPTGIVPARSVLSEWTNNSTSVWLLHNARSALHALWQLTRPMCVWLPAYVCSEVARAVPLGIQTCYYPLDEMLSPRTEFLSAQVRDGDHVLAIDYLGRPVGSDFISLVLARPEVGWVEDRAQALEPTSNAWGDWLLYSPRKLLGVPDGGILVARKKTLASLETVPATDFSFALPSLARFEDIDESDNERWYANHVREEAAMAVGNTAMSHLSHQILNTFDARADGDIRRSNYAILHRRLGEWALFPESTISYAPLGFPVRVKSAANLSSHLAGLRIFAARHWQALPSDSQIFASEHRLAGELLTLPCDYRYGEREMRRVADAVLQAMTIGA